MGDVTFLGLGAMGTALARCAMREGFRTVVWNRTTARGEPLAAEGAEHVVDLAEAIAASPISIVCVHNYAASDSALTTPAAEAALRDRILVQLSTGSPGDARRAAARARSAGVAGYLDGAIVDYPTGIGSEACFFLMSGDALAYEAAEPVITCLAPATRYLGGDPARASVLDSAYLAVLIPTVVGAISGAALCEAGGLAVGELRAMLDPIASVAAGAAKETLRKIEEDDLETTEAALRTYGPPFAHMAEAAKEAEISSEIPDFFLGLFDRAVQQGFGNCDVAALIRMLRQADR